MINKNELEITPCECLYEALEKYSQHEIPIFPVLITEQNKDLHPVNVLYCIKHNKNIAFLKEGKNENQ